MSDGELHAFAGLLGLSGLGLVMMAAFGFDQRFRARLADAVCGLAFFGFAAYLWRLTPSTTRYWYAVFALLVPLAVLLIRERRRARRRRLAAGLIPQMYVAPPPPTPLTPFPAPPPPLGAASATAPHAEPEPQRTTYQPLPSGLPRKQDAAPPSPSAPPAVRQPFPDSKPAAPEAGPGGVASGPGAPLPGRETFRHGPTAGSDTAEAFETSSRLRRPAYLEDRPRPGGGRHRASEPADEPPPEQWPPYPG